MAQRLGIYVRDDTNRRLESLRHRFGISNGTLLDALAMCMTEDEVSQLLARHKSMGELEDRLGAVVKGEVKDILLGKTPDQIAQVTAKVAEVVKGFKT